MKPKKLKLSHNRILTLLNDYREGIDSGTKAEWQAVADHYAKEADLINQLRQSQLGKIVTLASSSMYETQFKIEP